MKTTLMALMLFSLALTGCVIDPNSDYRGRNYGDGDWDHAQHADYHAEQGPVWHH